MDRQKAFDIMVTALREQGRRSMNYRQTVCLFRGENQNKCAIGHLIPDDLYDACFDEASTLYDIMENNIMIKTYGEWERGDLQFLSDMQLCHDNEDLKDWEPTWKAIAEKYGIKYTAP